MSFVSPPSLVGHVLKFLLQMSACWFLLQTHSWRLVALGIVGLVDAFVFPFVHLTMCCRWPYYITMSTLMFVFAGMSVTIATKLSLALVVFSFMYGTGLLTAVLRILMRKCTIPQPNETHEVDGETYEIMVDCHDVTPMNITPQVAPL